MIQGPAGRASPNKRAFGGSAVDHSLTATANAMVKLKVQNVNKRTGYEADRNTRSPKRQPRKKGYFDTSSPHGKRRESRPDSASPKDKTPGGPTARRNIQKQLT